MLVVVVTAATAFLVLMVVMLVVMMTAATAFLVLMVVMLVVVVTAAATFLVFMVVMLVVVVTAAATLFVLVMVMLVVMMTAAATLFVLVMVMVVLQLLKFLLQRVLPFHCFQKLMSGQLIPRCNHQGRIRIVLPQQRNGSIQLGLRNRIGTGQDDSRSRFDLVIIELTKVLHIDFHLVGIRHSHLRAQNHIMPGHLLHSGNHVTEFTNAGGFDEDAIGMILLDHLGQSLAKIAHKTAANTAGVHLGNIDTGILQEAAVNADLAKFIFNQNQVFTLMGLLDHFLN